MLQQKKQVQRQQPGFSSFGSFEFRSLAFISNFEIRASDFDQRNRSKGKVIGLYPGPQDQVFKNAINRDFRFAPTGLSELAINDVHDYRHNESQQAVQRLDRR
jgi:hypothetical protein